MPPIQNLQVHHEADLAQVLLEDLRSLLDVVEAVEGDHGELRSRLDARFLEQPPGFLRVVLPRRHAGQPPGRHLGVELVHDLAVPEQCLAHDLLLVHRHGHRAPHPHVVERRTLGVEVVPDGAERLDLIGVEGVGPLAETRLVAVTGGVDHVHLASAQGGQPHGVIGQRLADDLVQVWQGVAVGVLFPVGVVARHHGGVQALPGDELERPGGDRMPLHRIEALRVDDRHPAIGQHGRQRVVLVLQRRPQGEVVQQLDLVDDAQLAANHRAGSGVQDALQVGLDVGAGHLPAIVEGDVLADVPGPGQAVLRRFPGVRQSRHDVGVVVGLRKAVVDQRKRIGSRVRGEEMVRVQAADVAPQADLDGAAIAGLGVGRGRQAQRRQAKYAAACRGHKLTATQAQFRTGCFKGCHAM